MNEYGYTLTPDFHDYSKVGNTVSTGQERGAVVDSYYDQKRSYASVLAGVELMEDPGWYIWGDCWSLDQTHEVAN